MLRPTRKINLKTGKRRVFKGVIHVQAGFHNTIVTVTDIRGQVISWSSAGACGFKGSKKRTAFAADITTKNAIRSLAGRGMKQAEVMMSGPGLGRDTVLRAIRNTRITLTLIRDVTPMPHNGCRAPKRRRV